MIAQGSGTTYDRAVDFERVLRALLEAFDRHQIRYAAIGGFAMGA
jgi:hypothetical protein